MNDKYKPVRKKGDYNLTKTKQWDGNKWVPVNVVHRGQKATLNGKPVVADGRGNWRSPGTRGNSLEGTKPGRKVGRYGSGDLWRKPTASRLSTTSKPEVKKSGNIPASQRPSDMRQGQVYGNDSQSHGRNWSNPHGQVSNKPSEGDRSTWGKPKPKPEPKIDPPKPRNTTTRTTTTRPRTSPAPATSSNGQSLRQGRSPAKPTNKPKPAGKVYGSTGRKDLKQSARMADALKTLKVRDYGGSKKKPAAKKPAATKPEPTVSRPKPPATKPKPTATKPKPTATKPKPTAQKPLVVPTNQIPKDLSGAAGKKYLADLDSGKLTRKKK